MKKKIYDLAIIGGGINGTAIAADASGRGLSVFLCEQNDLASATSSSSSKLIHGGIRYLETLDFRLVRESLAEREILLHKAPHLVKPLRFIMPNVPKIRSAFVIRIGLYLYDHLGKHFSLAKSEFISLAKIAAEDHLFPHYKNAFCYSDCLADDSRLVVANALSAKKEHADILTYTTCTKASRGKDYWRIFVESKSNSQQEIFAKVLINATGPWTEKFLNQIGFHSSNKLVLVKGSHILIPRIYTGNHAYLLQHEDRRVVFIIPYLDKYTLIGTTDVNFEGNLGKIAISTEEITYLCSIVNRYFRINLQPKDILYTYSGVRPLKNHTSSKPANISRDYALEIVDENGSMPLLSIFGGKITTHRKLAETVLNKLRQYLPHMGPDWTANKTLPGGDIPNGDMQRYLNKLYSNYNSLPPTLIKRYASQYGTAIHDLLKGVINYSDLGEDYGVGLHHREVIYLLQNEWAKTSADILWRRTKLGYSFPQNCVATLDSVIAENS